MQAIASFSQTFFKWEASPVFYAIALSKKYRCYDSDQDRYFFRHELVYMDIVSAFCEAEAVFEAVSHYFSDRLTHRWQTREAALNAEMLAEIDTLANSLAFSFFRRAGTKSQKLFAESGVWQSNHGPKLTYEKSV